MRSVRGACVAALPWSEVEARMVAGAIPVLTVGAGSKEHGCHLPLDTDLRQATWLGQAMASRWPVLVWPAVSFGHYPAFVRYPGSINVSAAAFADTLRGAVTSIRAHTAAPIMIVNTGISTITPIDQVTQMPDVVAVHVYRGAHVGQARERYCQQLHGGHGDEAETAVMRFMAPDSVRMSAAQAWDKAMPAGILSRTESDPTYTPQGVWGRPDLATTATGRAIVNAMLADISTAWDMLHVNH